MAAVHVLIDTDDEENDAPLWPALIRNRLPSFSQDVTGSLSPPHCNNGLEIIVSSASPSPVEDTDGMQALIRTHQTFLFDSQQTSSYNTLCGDGDTASEHEDKEGTEEGETVNPRPLPWRNTGFIDELARKHIFSYSPCFFCSGGGCMGGV